MSSVQTDHVEYVRGLVLPEAPTQPTGLEEFAPERADVEAVEAPAQVNLRTLVSYVRGMSPALKVDVMNSLLLAQLAANHAAGGQENVTTWYDKFSEVTRNIGWTSTGFQRSSYEAGGDTFKIQQVVLDVLGPLLSGQALAIVTATLNALAALGDDDKRIVLFDTQTHDERYGLFEVAAASESDGVAVLEAGGFDFESHERVDRILWFDFSSTRTAFYKATDRMELNSQVYGAVREDIVAKLGDRAAKFVADLEIDQ
jgi:hypothetical protein